MVLGYGNHKAEVMEYCDSMGWEYTFFEPTEDVFHDLSCIIDDCKQYKYEKVVIYEPGDISEREVEYYYWKNAFLLLRKPVVCITPTMNPYFDKLLEQIYEYSYKVRPKRGNIVKARRAEKVGKYYAGTPPYGYIYQHHRYIVDEYEAWAVRELFRRVYEGQSAASVAEYLNHKGYRSRRGNKLDRYVSQWLKKRKFYEGYEFINGEWVKNHPAIIQEGVWVKK